MTVDPRYAQLQKGVAELLDMPTQAVVVEPPANGKPVKVRLTGPSGMLAIRRLGDAEVAYLVRSCVKSFLEAAPTEHLDNHSFASRMRQRRG